jgi:hypothetical protein
MKPQEEAKKAARAEEKKATAHVHKKTNKYLTTPGEIKIAR